MIHPMLKLLIIEDSKLIQARLLDWLDRLVNVDSIRVAGTLHEAYLSLQNQPADMLIVDLALPDGNAIHWLPRIAELLPEAVIAVFTNDATAFAQKKALESGAHFFFDKSVEIAELAALVQQQAFINPTQSQTLEQ